MNAGRKNQALNRDKSSQRRHAKKNDAAQAMQLCRAKATRVLMVYRKRTTQQPMYMIWLNASISAAPVFESIDNSPV